MAQHRRVLLDAPAGEEALRPRRRRERHDIAAERAPLGIVRVLDERGQPLRRRDAIGVREREDLAAAHLDAAVPRRVRRAPPRLALEPHRVALDHPRRPVRRAVVDDHDLVAPGGVALRDQ